MDIDHIRSQWQAGEVEFTDEAERRTAERGVSVANIGEAITTGRIIEERPRPGPCPKCTIQGWSKRSVAGYELSEVQLLNVACAISDVLTVITVCWEGEEP